MKTSVTVNGTRRDVEIDPRLTLVYLLRETFGLTGTHVGCTTGNCGACTVLLDGQEVQSCQVSVGDVGAKAVTTIEGLSKHGDHPLQKAWIEHDVPQCGYCQTGQIMAAAALLKQKPKPTDADIDEVFSRYVCRCGTYQRIREAIHEAAGAQPVGGRK